MRRPLLLWLTFACFLALALGAMGWMTRTVLRLEDLQARATAAAQVEENVRLALWRMDYALSPLISQETARPYFEYSPVFPAEQAYTRMYTQLKSGDVLVPSPLLRPATSSYVLLYFQVEPDGRVTSPQAPSGEVRRIAQQRFTTAADILAAERRLEQVRALANDPALTANLPPLREADAWSNGGKIRVTPNGSLASAYGTQAPPPGFSPPQRSGNESQSQSQVAQQPMPNAPAQQQQQAANPYDYAQQIQTQQLRGQQEYAARARNSLDNADLGNNVAANFAMPGVSASVMQPVWAGADTLILARQVSVNGRRYVQGCLLDWPGVRKWLLDSAADLVPGADLTPVRTPTDDKQPRMLASIPARLVLPAQAPVNSSFIIPRSALSSPTVITLLLAWSALLLAACAVALLLRGVIALSQRRAGFVSAVTHELRTPLTTLRMYTEMLADGMVADPEKQASYHKTLRAEANRLGHLVDNVLLYSRLERSARDTRVESARLGEVLDRLTPRLADRAAQAGMSMRMSVLDAAGGAEIRANLLSVEQILFNLVDNACKYAATAADRTIDLAAARTDGRVAIRVTDHGPGLDGPARARLFKPFSKSVHEAANTAPGLGLGLALSYRLAKNMNANLEFDPGTKNGAAFVLTLPLA
jgi:signal transduction histidine kinase